MNRRERLERRAERLRDWAERRETRAAEVFKQGEPFRGDIAFNTQPGHIPERARLIAREDRAFESMQKAESMRARADGIERQAQRAIFSDDVDARERIRAKIAKLEQDRETMKRINAAHRKGGIDAVRAGFGDAIADTAARTLAACPWDSRPFPAFELTNRGAEIRRMRERLAQIEIRNTRAAQADAAGGVLITERDGSDFARVTFAEKPDRAILDALRAAGWIWGAGSWTGPRATLPACVRDLASPPAEAPAEQQAPPATDGGWIDNGDGTERRSTLEAFPVADEVTP